MPEHRPNLTIVLLSLFMLAYGTCALASEVLLFDGSDLSFTHADNGFHPLIVNGDPLPMNNWLNPIDYYHGEIHIRYVITGPDEQEAGRLQICIWTMGNDGDGRNYFPESCSAQVHHNGVGEYFDNRSVPSGWWNLGGKALDYSRPDRFLIRVVLRGASGCSVTRHSVKRQCWEDWPKYKNMMFRTTIVMVGEGDVFSGWQNYP
jgi:hypothetical protein